MTFRLPSLDMATQFDKPIVPATVPGTLGVGSVPAMYILDGASRGPKRLARINRATALLGFKVATDTDLVLDVTLLTDPLATQMWERLRPRPADARPMQNDDELTEDEEGQHRLVVVGVQGRPRGLVLLRRTTGEEGARGTFRVRIPRSDIGDEDLIALTVENASSPPSWAAENLREDSPIGLCVVRVRLGEDEAPDGTYCASVFTGRDSGRPRADGSPAVALDPELSFFVANPDPSQGSVLIASRAAPDSLPGRRAKVKHPVRALRERLARRRLGSDGEVRFTVADLGGTEIVDGAVPVRSGKARLALPAGSGPCYVRLTPQAGEAGWKVRIRAGGSERGASQSRS